MNKITVGIIGDPNALALALTENLLANLCKVKIFSSEKGNWISKTTHIKSSNDFEIFTEDKIQNNFFEYFIYINLTTEKLNVGKEVENIEKVVREAKGIFVFSYYCLNEVRSNLKKINERESIVFVGDLIGPRMDLTHESPILGLLKASLSKKPIKIKAQSLYYPLFIPDVARVLVKWLFSFGPYGDSVALICKEVGLQDLLSLIKKNLGYLNITEVEDIGVKTPNIQIRKYTLSPNINNALKETIFWISNNNPQEYYVEKEKTWGKMGVLFLAVLVLMSPFLLTLVSAFSLFLIWKEILWGKSFAVNSMFSAASLSADISQKESSFLSYIPLAGGLYKRNLYLANLLDNVSQTGRDGFAAYQNAIELLGKIFGDDIYDPEPYSQQLSLDFNSLYKDISLFESELNRSPNFAKPIVANFLKGMNLDDVKNIALNGEGLARQLPQLLGAGKSTTYTVLLQNNMELRPTGGFIGSFALVTFNGGRLTDINVQDVYNADGQLKGHVEPPEPIRNYLGEAGWHLRDSNWDPDFGVSAQRAEWFLDKEIDKSVDGVVALDLDLVKSVLSGTGPIYLFDFNTQVDSGNLYQKIQSEVESNFFPGSIKKQTFLTSLTRELLSKITKMDKKTSLLVAKAILASLEEKHIQVFLHNQEAQKGISSLSWDGGVPIPDCSGNCYADWLGVVEANVGVNKVNYYVKRQEDFSVQADNQTIKRKLSVVLENTGTASAKNPNNYKDYIRILIPLDSNLAGVRVKDISREVSLTPEIADLNGRREVGVLVNILPGEKKEVVFDWDTPNNLDFGKRGEFRFYWRKQAGTNSDPIKVNINLPDGLVVKGSTSYNTSLARDFFSRVSW